MVENLIDQNLLLGSEFRKDKKEAEVFLVDSVPHVILDRSTMNKSVAVPMSSHIDKQWRTYSTKSTGHGENLCRSIASSTVSNNYRRVTMLESNADKKKNLNKKSIRNLMKDLDHRYSHKSPKRRESEF